jgi:hypothetical protein
MRLLLGIALIACSMFACSSNNKAASSIEPERLQTQIGSWLVEWQPNPNPIPLNEPFSLIVSINPALPDGPSVQDIQLSVDGRMPHHRHGMNRTPEITQRKPGEFQVDNMLFHMPGRWELYFDISHRGTTERAQSVVFLE